jgi:hypothetical protein
MWAGEVDGGEPVYADLNGPAYKAYYCQSCMENKKTADRIMYCITHVNKDGFRQLTFANQGRNHYDTRESAENAMKPYEPDLRAKILGDLADTLEVRMALCYHHGDAKKIYFD